MTLNLEQLSDQLKRTPAVLRALLEGLPEDLIRSNEGPGTWSPFDVVGHLIHGEQTDYIPRAKMILEHGVNRAFEPFDREAMLKTGEGKTFNELLDEFAALRSRNLETLRGMKLSQQDLARKGTHPALGEVTLGELLATWFAHDLDHLVQILRTAAKQYGDAVGPWREYLSVMTDRTK